MAKSYKNLYPAIHHFNNLYLAHQMARQGKKKTAEMHEFQYAFELNLWDLEAELKDGSYRPGPYRNFYIYEPKKRKVSAAPFRDRIVHHALCQIIQPLFERQFIYDSYANRLGKGVHKALDRAQPWVATYRYVLKADILKFFPSVDHQILMTTLAKTIACPKTIGLCQHILDSGRGILANEYPMQWFPGDNLLSRQERERGLPIGNLTSQFWANVLLNRLDHFVKETLTIRPYLRYIDDFLIFGNHKESLWAAKEAIEAFLADLRLSLHPHKCHVMPTQEGVPFLGFRLFAGHRRLLASSLRRARRRLKQQRQAMANGELTPQQFRRSLASWIGHVGHGDTWQLRRQLLSTPVWPVASPIV